MPTPELDVLLPAETNSETDDYFVLTNAHVVYESNGKPASLLSAYADVPLRVEGRLEPPSRSLTKCLVKKPYRSVDLTIRRVTRYAYGKFTDGEIVVWAQGDAGHYLLRPAPQYKEIYNGMLQAIELLYFMADIYNEPRKRGGGPNARLVFQEYAEDERFECSDTETAENLFRKHHPFLIMCFLNRAQDIGWSNTPIYQFFKRQYPKVFESIKARKEGRYDDVHKDTRSDKPTSAPTARSSRSTRSRSHTQKPSERPKKDDNWWEAAAIYEFIRSAVNKRVLRPGRDHITLDRVADLMTKRYEIEEAETARNVLLVHAQNLCYKIDHPRSKSAKFLAEEPIYRELGAGHDLPAAEIRRAQCVELRPRRDHTLLEAVESDSSESEAPDEVVVTPPRQRDRRKKKSRLSLLRPKSGKFSGKGKTVKARKGPGMGGYSSEEVDSSAEPGQEADAESDTDSVIAIDTPTLAVSPSREKRKFMEGEDDDDDEEKGRRKRAASSSISPDSPPDSSDSAAAEADNEAPLPLRNRPNHDLANGKAASNAQPKSDLVVPIISTPLPTYEPNGPRDSWNCTFDGCNQKIYGASKLMGRQLITEHLEDHARGRQQVVGIIWRENQKLALPVNNLLKKIREMGESQMPLFPQLDTSSSALQPEPIRRML